MNDHRQAYAEFHLGKPFKYEPEVVATIILDREDAARGEIRICKTAEGFEVDCLTPEGDREEGLLPAFATRMEAIDAIEATWGRGWGLEWLP